MYCSQHIQNPIGLTLHDSQVDNSFLPLLWNEYFPQPLPGVYIFVKRHDKGHNGFALLIKVIYTDNDMVSQFTSAVKVMVNFVL